MSATEKVMETSEPKTRSIRSSADGVGNVLKNLQLNTNKFMENFNPETSARQQRKLTRKLSTPTLKKITGALYDQDGLFLETGDDICDCLTEDCFGCFYPCEKCGSVKCGFACRVNRKYIIDQIDFEGGKITYVNKHSKIDK